MISTNIKYVHKIEATEVPEMLFWFCFLIRDVANEDGVLGDVVGRVLMLVHVRAGDCLLNNCEHNATLQARQGFSSLGVHRGEPAD